MGTLRALAVVLVVLAAPAAAQPPPVAAKLFEEGRELAKQERWAEACDKFSKSLELDPAPGTKLNLGECLEKQGQVRKGWLMYAEAARDFDRTGDGRAKFAHDRANDASAKLATIVIRIADSQRPGLVVKIGDRSLTPQPEIVERADVGTFDVVATAPNKQTFTASVDAASGRTTVVDIPALADPVSVQPHVDEPTRGKRRPRVILATVLGGAGVVGLGVGLVVGLSARSQYKDAFGMGKCMDAPGGPICPSNELKDQIDEAGTKADIATGLWIIGAGLVTAGVVVYLTAPKETGVTIAPTATDSSAGVVLGGRF